MITPYASRTGTRKNLAVLRRNGWRLLVSARGVLRNEGFPYAIDNGAWTSHQRGEPFDVGAFERAVEWGGSGADWLILPDIVGGGVDSLRVSMEWAPRLSGIAPLLLAVQDGMTPADVSPIVGDDIGIAVGGSTGWKLDTIPQWGRLAASKSCRLHALRVNSIRRLRLCQDAGCTSFDGSGPSRFAAHGERMSRALRQTQLFERR